MSFARIEGHRKYTGLETIDTHFIELAAPVRVSKPDEPDVWLRQQVKVELTKSEIRSIEAASTLVGIEKKREADPFDRLWFKNNLAFLLVNGHHQWCIEFANKHFSGLHSEGWIRPQLLKIIRDHSRQYVAEHVVDFINGFAKEAGIEREYKL